LGKAGPDLSLIEILHECQRVDHVLRKEKKKKQSQALWFTPVIPATFKAEARGFESLRPARAKFGDPISETNTHTQKKFLRGGAWLKK
jgi:hypothetical protein